MPLDFRNKNNEFGGALINKRQRDELENALINKNRAKKELVKSRKELSDYITSKRNTTGLGPIKKTSVEDLESKLSERVELQKNISPNTSPLKTQKIEFGDVKNNDFDRQVRKRSLINKQIQESPTTKMLKQDVSNKQSQYNYQNYLYNLEQVKKDETGFLDKLITPITSGVQNMLDFSRLTNTTSQVDEQGNISYLPTKSDLKYQKVREDSGIVGKVYGDIAYNLSQATVAKAIDVLTGSPTGSILYYGNIVDGSVQEAKNKGFDDNEALAYGLGTGVVAGVLDKFVSNLGGLTKVSNKIPTLEKGLDKLIFKLTSNKTASLLLSNLTSEGISEAIEEYVNNALAYVIDSDSREQESFLEMLMETTPDAMYSMFIGSLSGGVSTPMTLNTEETQVRKKALEEYRKTLENYKPQSVAEANYKNDQINAVDGLYNEMERIAQEEIEKKQEEVKEQPKQDVVKEQPIKEKPTKEVNKSIKYTNDEKLVEKNKVVDNTKTTIINKKTNYNENQDLKKLEEEHKKTVDVINKFPTLSRDEKQKRLLQESYSYNHNKREVIQGDSLIPVEGGLTQKELNRKINHLKSNYVGKEVILDDGRIGKIKKQVYGKYTIELDNNELVTLTKDKFKSKVDIDVLINEQKSAKKENHIIKESKQQIKEAKKVNPNLDTNLAEKQVEDVLRVSENSSNKETQKAIDIVTPAGKNKKTVSLDDGQKYIEPSAEVRNKSVEEVIEYANNTVTEKEKQQIETENKKRRKGYDAQIAKYENDPDTKKFLETRRDENLYEVRHTKYNVTKETFRLLEDPEHYYNETMKTYRNGVENNTLNKANRMDLLEKIEALIDYYGDIESKNYNSVISRELSDIYAELGTNPAQELAIRSAWLKNSPKAVAYKTERNLRQMYKEESQKHLNDTAWLNENDPRKNPNSKYNLTDKQFNTINYFANELNNIKDKNSVEYNKKTAQLDSYIQNIFGSFTLSSSIKKATTLNVLASTRIWFTNIRGNIFNMAQVGVIDKLPRVFADKIISNFTDIRTSGISVQGDVVQGARAFKNGLSEGFFEFKHDVSLSKFDNKYVETNENTSFDKLGEKHNTFKFNENTKVGRLMNKYSNFVNFCMNIGDKPFAYMYYEQSIYNQRLSQARINATKEKTNYIYNIKENKNNYTVSYIDAEGRKNVQSMTEKQYNKLLKESKIQDISESMCEIAEREALENTFQDENKITDLALKYKKVLNDTVHIGDFGLGDMMLKFTKTGSNMAKSLYEHSPLETITLIKDIKTLNKNIKDANKNNTQINSQLQYKVASDFGKLLGGTITTAMMAGLVSTGLIKVTGDEEDDKAGKFTSGTTGFQPYSIKIGNYNYSLDSGSTFSSLLKMGTDIGKLLEDGNNLLQSYWGSADTFINELIESSFVNNILDLTNTQYSSIIENFTQQLASQPANMIPSFLKDISITLDSFTERQVYDDNPIQYMYNQIINRTPLRGTSVGLKPKRDNWGELKTIGGDTLASAFNTFYSSGLLTREKRDVVSDEIVRVYTSTNDTDAIPKLTMSQSYFKYNKETYNLTNDEKSSLLTSYAKYAHSAVEDLMKKSVYKNSTDEEKLKLIQKAYDYADELSKKEYLENKGEKYYNFASKDGKYTEYKKTAFEEIISDNISIEEANYKRQYNNSYKLKTAITNWEDYNQIRDDIEEIKETYSTDNGYSYKTRKYAVQTYIKNLSGLSNVQKAMLSKIENSKGDYSNYDKAIEKYVKSLSLSDEEYEYIYEQLGLGGYWSMYWKKK